MGIGRGAILVKVGRCNPLSHDQPIEARLVKFIFNIAFTILPFQKVRNSRASHDARVT
jgi:heme/copper-type cytochrome/quinol oxidase subunit 4